MKNKGFHLNLWEHAFVSTASPLYEPLKTRAGNYIAGQLIRCGLAPALLYGEAQSAESREDFVHKMKIILKELKESRVCIKIILHKQLIKPISRLSDLYKECEELIAIAAKSIATAKKNIDKELP